MRVVGVDPGLTRCGLAAVEGGPGRRAALLGVTVVGTAAELPLADRLCALESAVSAWLDEHSPDEVAVEAVFSQHNTASVVATAQAAGVATLVAGRRGLPVTTHSPTEVKAGVTGHGRADKQQVSRMVTAILGLAAPPRPVDATDALALALAHLWQAPVLARRRTAQQARVGFR
ncbi:MAG: crossover junction endodeoxyribonuclease RuvC [Actinomycetia bacterium]|nr:crossover junction endodeoxyribonuclease RuvC [Actinomycetes bacterium]